MRTVFFGTPEFAVPTLQRLIESPHPPLAVVSQPDRRRGRGRRSAVTPVAQCARAAGIEVLQPESAGDPIFQERLRALEPDIGVVVAFGQFLPRAVRELPRRGYLLNGHASLLPRHRGAAVIPIAPSAGRRRLDAFYDCCRAHAGADAECREAGFQVAAFELVEQGTEDHRPGGAERMAHGDGAAIDVDLVV